ncbi:HNH endonuclease [Sporosarcina sp. FSL W7-1283]|uniref:HNH endonuclease n=1 Tax=Sporosarcina sp. FSL W7-1283 TaxID=2921560 RepID=UPI0030F8F001
MSEVKKRSRGRRLTIEQVKEEFESKGCLLLSKQYNRISDTLSYKCKCGNIAEKSLKNFKSYPYCKECARNDKSKETKGRSKYSYETVKEYFEQYGCELITTDYRGVSQKLDYKCHCGRKAEITFSKFKQGRRCMQCAIETRANKRRHPYEKVKTDFESVGYQLITTVDKYVDASSKIDFICDQGHKRSTTYRSFREGIRCTGCSGHEKHTFEYVQKLFLDSGCVLLDDKYINNETKLNYICSCGNKSSIKLQNFIMGKRCYECRSDKIAEAIRLPYKYVQNYFEENGCTLISKEYKSLSSKLKYICKCGRKGFSSFATFKESKQCKKCSFDALRNPNLTDEDRVNQRKIEGYEAWRIAVYKRDNYTCQCCGDNWSGKLNAHHKDGYHWCQERRLDVTNGITLCEECHRLGEFSFHAIFGNANNTEEQFEEWFLKYKAHNLKERRIS